MKIRSSALPTIPHPTLLALSQTNKGNHLLLTQLFNVPEISAPSKMKKITAHLQHKILFLHKVRIGGVALVFSCIFFFFIPLFLLPNSLFIVLVCEIGLQMCNIIMLRAAVALIERARWMLEVIKRNGEGGRSKLDLLQAEYAAMPKWVKASLRVPFLGSSKRVVV